jgi:hypothetical protein
MAAGAGQPPFDESEYGGQLPEDVTAAGNASEPIPEVPHSQDEVAMVRRATEVLGIDYVAGWMRSKIPSLGNQTPYTLLKTEDGRKQVERVLLKIEHGVY